MPAAASRLGIAPSTAVEWLPHWQRAGGVQPRPRGEDERSRRLGSPAVEILALIDETPEITRAEIVAHLERQHSPATAPSTVRRPLDRHGVGF